MYFFLNCFHSGILLFFLFSYHVLSAFHIFLVSNTIFPESFSDILGFFPILSFFSFRLGNSNLDIFLRADSLAGVAADTFSGKRGISVDVKVGRTAFFAGAAFRRTGVSVTVK